MKQDRSHYGQKKTRKLMGCSQHKLIGAEDKVTLEHGEKKKHMERIHKVKEANGEW